MTSRKLALVIPTHNRIEYLMETLLSLRGTKHVDHVSISLTIIDDASESDIQKFIDQFQIDCFDQVEKIFLERKSDGVCELNLLRCWQEKYDQGFDLFCVLDSDVVLHPLWAHALITRFDRYRNSYRHLIASAFDTLNHPTLEQREDSAIKKSMGGVNMLFDRMTFVEIIKPCLTVSKLSWDWQVVAKMNLRSDQVFLATTPSYVQHIGKKSSARDSTKHIYFDQAHNFTEEK